ncbi:MAG: hypothetical protein ACI9CD_001108 [Candidatus Deianiraeaceae bacterium]|jgi:hypothetical protein
MQNSDVGAASLTEQEKEALGKVFDQVLIEVKETVGG